MSDAGTGETAKRFMKLSLISYSFIFFFFGGLKEEPSLNSYVKAYVLCPSGFSGNLFALNVPWVALTCKSSLSLPDLTKSAKITDPFSFPLISFGFLPSLETSPCSTPFPLYWPLAITLYLVFFFTFFVTVVFLASLKSGALNLKECDPSSAVKANSNRLSGWFPPWL